MKFKQRKYMTIGLAIGFGFLVILSFGLFVKLKVPQEKIPDLNNKSLVDYKQWADKRIEASENSTSNTANSGDLQAVKLQVSSNKNGVTKKIDAASISGTPIYQYGRAIFSIDDSDLQKKISKQADLYDNSYQLSAANMIARILQVAGYRPPAQASNTSYTVTKQDALNYIGKFLNENQPFYGPTLSFNPISIVNDLSWDNYYRNMSYFDDNFSTPGYASSPMIAITNLFGDTLDFF